MKIFTKKAARAAALVGIMAASIECAKLALAAIPNVEVVTLLIAVYSYVFGAFGVLASLIFVLIEPLIWGFGTWFISYLIYWPLVALVFSALGARGVSGRVIPTVFAVILTILFGVISSFVDVGIFSGSFDNLFYRFSVYYLRGIGFYLAEIITNAVLFPLLFLPITRLLSKIKKDSRL